jgi:glyoxylase-like metal-dependent hydrolase (beta-lactamase superfamily II)
MRAEVPAAFGPEGEWVLHFHCFLLRVPGGPTVLVDTGLGTDKSPASSWAPVPGVLFGALEDAAVSPEGVDTVVLTHLHSDHASGAVLDGKPLFPNARHVVQEDEVRWLKGEGGAVLDDVVRPLREAGLLDVVKGESRLSEEIEVFATPGHTPGHQSVMVGEDRLVVSGDVVLHPVQLADPSVKYLYDEDADAAASTRMELLRRMRRSRGVLAAPHLPEPFVSV